MDSFIEKRQNAIKNLQMTMLIKYSFCILLLLALPLWVTAMKAQPSPEDWQSTEAVCAEVQIDNSGKEAYAVLTAEDGALYVADPQLIEPETLYESVAAGESFQVLYAQSGENRIIKAFSTDEDTLLEKAQSEAQWEKSRTLCIVAIIVTLVVTAGAAFLTYHVWCKKDHLEIKRLKAEIQKREERNEKRAK